MKTETTTPEADANQHTLYLVKNRQHYIVRDSAAYAILRSIGVPMLRIHQDFLPIVQEFLGNREIEVETTEFKTAVFEPWLEKTTGTWGRKYGTVKVEGDSRAGTISFLASCKRDVDPTTDEKLQQTKVAVDKLTEIITQFFQRWGYRVEIVYSEKIGGTKIKLHVEYRFDVERMPIVPLETPVQELKEYIIKFGFARVVLQFDEPKAGKDIAYVHVRFEVSQGGTWAPVHTSRCTPTQISTVLPMMNALMKVRALDVHNADNEAV